MDVRGLLPTYLPTLADDRREALARLWALHEKYREAARLSAAFNPRDYVVQLVLDSTKFTELVDFAPGERVADVGSGAGYPGLVLALCRPEVAVTLIERSPKKAEYLRLAARELGLANVAVLACDAKVAPAGAFDLACAKALADAATTLRLLGRLVRPGGRMVVFATAGTRGAYAKAAGAAKEITVLPYRLPGLAQERFLIIFGARVVSRETLAAAPANPDRGVSRETEVGGGL